LTGKNCLIVSLSTILVSTLVLASTTGGGNLYSPNYGWAGQGTYDPWLDVNDDGKIDVNDSIAVWQAYGTTGNPTKPVVVTGYDWKTFYYEIEVPPLSYGLLDIPTAGYSAVTLGLSAYGSNPHTTDKYLTVSTSFKIENQYQYIEGLSLKIPWGLPIYIVRDVYVEPGYVGYNASTVNAVGKSFNVTVQTLLTGIHTFRLVLYYNSQVLKNTKVWLSGYVSGNISYSTYLIWNIIIVDGELRTWFLSPTAPFMLAGYEFEVTLAPQQNQTITSPLIIGKDIPEGAPYVTWFKDPQGNTVDYTWSNGLYEYYTITKYDATYTITRTYDVKGTTLRLRYDNPNDFKIRLNIGAYLTTVP
jgi:hypothetical protein